MFKVFYGLLCVVLVTPLAQAYKDDVAPKIKVNETKRLSGITSSNQFSMIGKSTFSILFWDLYTSKLMTTSGQYPIDFSQNSLIFHIEYLADISRKDLIKRTVDQWQYIGLKESDYQYYLPKLKVLWPDIKAGDSLGLLVNQYHSRFYFNDQFIGQIDDANFGQQFIDIWLSEKTSQPDLRAALLGSH